MSEIFNAGKIKYEGPKSKNPLAFKYYDADKDGKMHIDEMNKITTLTLDFDNIFRVHKLEFRVRQVRSFIDDNGFIAVHLY